jgi:hypothetical protein
MKNTARDGGASKQSCQTPFIAYNAIADLHQPKHANLQKRSYLAEGRQTYYSLLYLK